MSESTQMANLAHAPASIENILVTAQNIVDGPRQLAYGHPEENHSCTSDMIRAFLARKYGQGGEFDALDVCIVNILQKVSRLANTPDHMDSLVDICGYARNYQMILERRGAFQVPAK